MTQFLKPVKYKGHTIETQRDFGKTYGFIDDNSSLPTAVGKTKGETVKKAKTFIDTGGIQFSKKMDTQKAKEMRALRRIKKRQNKRSRKSRKVDRYYTAKNTYEIDNKKGRKKWLKNPNKCDIKGIDNRGNKPYMGVRPVRRTIERKYIKKKKKKFLK